MSAESPKLMGSGQLMVLEIALSTCSRFAARIRRWSAGVSVWASNTSGQSASASSTSVAFGVVT